MENKIIIQLDGKSYALQLEPMEPVGVHPEDFPELPYYMCQDKPKLSATHPDCTQTYKHSMKMFDELDELWNCYADPVKRFAQFMKCYDVVKKDTWPIPMHKVDEPKYRSINTNEFGQKRI